VSRYTSATDRDREAMLAAIGLGSVEELFAEIPEGVRLRRALDLPPGRSEQEVYGELRDKQGFHFLRYYLAGVLQDVCGWPREVTKDTPDPYAVVSYLKAVCNSREEGPHHDSAR